MPLISSHKKLDQFLIDNPRIAGAIKILKKDSIGFQAQIGDFEDRFDFSFSEHALEALVAYHNPPSFESLKERAGSAKSLEELPDAVMLDLALNMLHNSKMHLAWFAKQGRDSVESLEQDCGWMWDRAKAYFVVLKLWKNLIPAEQRNLFNNLMAPHK